MESSPLRERGLVYTFYSFKGGVGRSMALANVAAMLSKWGKRVLVVDWDLEAPGIEKYFGRWLEGSRGRTPGLVELVDHLQRDDGAVKWRGCLLRARIPRGEPIAILHAGLQDDNYNARLRAVDWESLFAQHNFGAKLEALREQWVAEYDFVLGRVNTTGVRERQDGNSRAWRSRPISSPASSTACPSSAATSA